MVKMIKGVNMNKEITHICILKGCKDYKAINIRRNTNCRYMRYVEGKYTCNKLNSTNKRV